ncbi:replication endonuclease [Pseudomonas aeruginosa]|nr:replication endonuclease [Pseudomonas aeruginosa]MDF5976736.1 replication endonuclease [Pseudomonas aeruginosa]
MDEVAYQDPRTGTPLRLRYCSPSRISGIAKTLTKSNCKTINNLNLQASLGLIDENQLRIEKEKFLQDLWVCEDEGLHRHINFSMEAEMAIKRACDYRSIKRKLIKVANEERINEEAKKGQVGGKTMQPYCSDRTLEFRKRQEEASHKSLEKIYVKRKSSDHIITLAEIAKKQELRKFNHLFHVSKNIQAMADDLGFKGYFVTFTAPGNYHPNPTKGKRSYNQDSLRNAHTYLQDHWKLIRARLAKADVPLSISTLFGMRFVEVHKDGCAHWHLLIFTNRKNFSIFRELANEFFPAHRQWDYKKINRKKGSATSYLFKYVAKAVDSSKFEDARLEQNEQDDELFELDRASLAHAKRVTAALRAQGIRQYQCFGIGNAITKYRLINKIEECVSSFTSETMRNTLSACRMYNNGKKIKITEI